jgi:hypothetical protein
MELDVSTEGSSTDVTSHNQEGDTPEHQIFLLSRLNLPWNFEFDSSLYWVSPLKSQTVPSYVRLDLRLGWQATEHLELSLVGQNLTDGRHAEFENGLFSLRSQVPRSVYAMVTCAAEPEAPHEQAADASQARHLVQSLLPGGGCPGRRARPRPARRVRRQGRLHPQLRHVGGIA